MKFHFSSLSQLAAISSVCLLAGGCATPRADLQYDLLYSQGSYRQAAMAFEDGIKNVDIEKRNILDCLHLGAALFNAGDYTNAIGQFDHADALINEQTEQLTLGLSKLSGKPAFSYDANHYEGILVHTYKALGFIADGNIGLARVELNRADERQRRAVDEFSKKIKKIQAEIDEEKQRDNNSSIPLDSLVGGIDSDAHLGELTRESAQWGAYADFVNPFTTYLQGLFLLLWGDDSSDLERAAGSFERAAGMVNNTYARLDLALAHEAATGGVSRDAVNNYVWVIYENGLGPLKEEKRFDLILPLNPPAYFGIAVPKLAGRPEAYPFLDLRSNGANLGKTEPICSMDSVVASEFNQLLPGIYTRALISASIKTFLQYQASRLVQQKYGAGYGLLASAALGGLQAATTKADIRIWAALPKNIQIARIEKPGNGNLELWVPGAVAPLANMPVRNGPMLLYVKVPSTGATAICVDLLGGEMAANESDVTDNDEVQAESSVVQVKAK